MEKFKKKYKQASNSALLILFVNSKKYWLYPQINDICSQITLNSYTYFRGVQYWHHSHTEVREQHFEICILFLTNCEDI